MHGTKHRGRSKRPAFLSFEKGISSIKVPFVSIIAFERLNASFEPYSLGEKSPFGHLEAFRMEKGLSIKVPLAARP